MALDRLSSNEQLKAEQEQARAEREQANADTLLLLLPPELRNSIFISALTHPSIYKFFVGPDACSTSSGILRVSRQIRKETLPLFYGQCCFTLLQEDLYFGKTWLERIPTDALAFVRKISCNAKVDFWEPSRSTHYHQLKVNIDRTSDGFRCSVVCGLEQCIKENEMLKLRCPAVERISALAAAVLNRTRSYIGSTESARKDLWELMKILSDAQREGLSFWNL